jgi:prepilin peptidase CpaA
MHVSLLPFIATSLALAVAVVTDVRHYKIPNALTFPLLLSGGLYQVFSPFGQGIGYCVLGFLVATLPLLVMHFRGAMGAGDVKLVAGLGVWLGPVIGINGVFITLSVHAIFSLFVLAMQRRMFVAWHAMRDTESLLASPSASNLPNELTRIPFSLGIAIGFLSAFVFCPLP